MASKLNVTPELHAALLHVITTYDLKQSKRPGYNRYALSQYFGALAETERLLARGETPTYAVIAYFNEPLASRLLKEVVK